MSLPLTHYCRFRLYGLFFIFLLAPSIGKAFNTIDCKKSLRLFGQTGIEMESEFDHYFTLSQAVVEHSETTTGTLAPLLAAHEIPWPLVKYLEAAGGAKKTREVILALRWKSLPSALRVEILDDLHAQKMSRGRTLRELLPHLSPVDVEAVRSQIPALAKLSFEAAYNEIFKLTVEEVPTEVLAILAERDPHAFLADLPLALPLAELTIPFILPPDEYRPSSAFDRCTQYLRLREKLGGDQPKLKDLSPQLQADFLEVMGGDEVRNHRESMSNRQLAFTAGAMEVTDETVVSPAFLEWKTQMTALGLDWRKQNMRGVPKNVAADLLRHFGIARMLERRRKIRGHEEWNQDRSLFGLRPPSNVVVDFVAPTTLFGKFYPVGRHRVFTGALFEPLVENLSEEARPSHGLELKLRAGRQEGLSTSQVIESTWKLQALMGMQPTSLHAHVVDEMSAKASVPAALEMERRLGLIEAFRLVEQGEPIEVREEDGIHTFGPTSPQYYGPRVRKMLNTVIHAGKWVPRQKGHVDFRGPDVYGAGPNGRPNVGFDFRTVSADHYWPELAPIVDRVQSKMKDPNYGIPMDAWNAWYRHHYGESSDERGQALIDLQWNRELPQLLKALKPELKQVVTPHLIDRIQSLIALKDGSLSQSNLEVKLLLQDWSREPTLYGKSDVIKQVEVAQLNALRQLQEGRNPTAVVRDFVVVSGLRKIVTESFGARYVKVDGVR